MNDVQSRLAELLKAGVGDPPARVTVQAVRRRRARRRGAAAVGAAAAVAVVAVIGAGLSGRLGSPSPAVSPTVSAAPVPCRTGWHVASGAVPAGDYEDRLVAVAGSASDDVWAVGDRWPNPRQVLPLMDHWDGRRWSYSAGASLGGRQALLTSVTATASGDVWAVGHFAAVGRLPSAPLIEHWNGSSWSLQPTHSLTRLKTALPQALTSAVALAHDDVWVLGHSLQPSGAIDVYVHWNGTSWKLLPGPDIGPRLGGSGSVDPTGLAAVSADDAYVIGQNATTQQLFIDHWDGTRWRSVPLGPAGHMRRPGPRAIEFRSPSLTVTSDGSIASLDTQGLHDRANFLWLRCQH